MSFLSSVVSYRYWGPLVYNSTMYLVADSLTSSDSPTDGQDTRMASATSSQLEEYLRLNMGSFSDITLQCEGKSFPAHKLLLAASSTYFSALFSGSWQEEGDGSMASLQAVSATGLAAVLRSLYGRPARLSLATVEQVLQAADFLGVAAVTATCQVFLSRNLVPGTVLGVGDMAREGMEALEKD